MLVGVPREIKAQEYRVGLTPSSVREYVAAGHSVLIEREAGAVRQGSGCVALEVTDLRDGCPHVVRGRYLLACDGGSSQICGYQ